MVINRKVNFMCLLIFSFIILSCEDIDYKSMEVNHLKRTLKIVDSEDFIIDSLIVFKDGREYLSIGLIDKTDGYGEIKFDDIDSSKYSIYTDNLKELCNRDSDELISGDLTVFIRKKGFKENVEGSNDYKNIQSFNYKYIPCSGEIITNVSAERKYK